MLNGVDVDHHIYRWLISRTKDVDADLQVTLKYQTSSEEQLRQTHKNCFCWPIDCTMVEGRRQSLNSTQQRLLAHCGAGNANSGIGLSRSRHIIPQ